jgi:hypothetical protein
MFIQKAWLAPPAKTRQVVGEESRPQYARNPPKTSSQSSKVGYVTGEGLSQTRKGQSRPLAASKIPVIDTLCTIYIYDPDDSQTFSPTAAAE